MPFVSGAQRGYLHAHPEVLGKKALKEWDAASKGQHVPYRIHEHSKASYSIARKARGEENGR
jgi:hypothetical protein